jgi:hypothetical protein
VLIYEETGREENAGARGFGSTARASVVILHTFFPFSVFFLFFFLLKILFFINKLPLSLRDSTWSQSYDRDLQRQRCKFLQRHG